MGKSSDPPPAPDYVGAAKEQGQANVEAAQTQAALNRVNTNTPYGSLTYSQPDKNNPNQWQADVSLSPEQQALMAAQNEGQQAKAADATAMLGRVQQGTGTPFDTSGLTSRVGSLGGPDLSMYTGSTTAPNATVDTSGVPQLDTNWGEQAKQAQDAAYAKATSMLDPQYAQAEEAQRARLEASGVTAGSQAFSNSMDDFNRRKSADYGSARDSAIAAGNQEQATLAGESLAGNNQLYAQALSNANLGNTAQAQTFGEGLAGVGANNTVGQQKFQDTAAAGTYADQQRSQEIAEQAYLRELPLNEFNALATGAQVTQPNFNVGTAQVNAPGAAPIFAGTQAAAGNALDIYNQDVSTNNANTGAAAGVASTAIMAVIF